MKKIIIIASMFLICFFTGCSKQEEATFIFGTDLCEYNMYITAGTDIGINIPFAYNVSKDDIKLIGLEGENIDISDINFFDDTLDVCNEIEIDGYKLGYFGLIVRECKESFTVNELKIEIAGKEENLIFNTPLTIRICDNGDDIYERNTADLIGTGGKNGLLYSFGINNNITVTGYDITGVYIVEEAQISSEGIRISKFPYKIYKDETILFMLETNTNDEDEYKFLGFDFLIEYTNEAGEKCTYYVPVRQQGAGDEESCYNLLKLIVENFGDKEIL